MRVFVCAICFSPAPRGRMPAQPRDGGVPGGERAGAGQCPPVSGIHTQLMHMTVYSCCRHTRVCT
eukprot:1158086-Pelagomonas_calceolata.AAC.7